MYVRSSCFTVHIDILVTSWCPQVAHYCIGFLVCEHTVLAVSSAALGASLITQTNKQLPPFTPCALPVTQSWALPEMQIPQFMLAAIWKSESCPPTLHTHCLFHTIDLKYIYLIIYLLILYAVSLIEKSAIISKLSYWASNCTLIHPIRSARFKSDESRCHSSCANLNLNNSLSRFWPRAYCHGLRG